MANKPMSIERELGTINTQIAAIVQTQAETKEEYKEDQELAVQQRHAMQKDIADIKAMMNKVQGGWAALLIIGSVAGAVGAFVLKVWTLLGIK